MAKKSEDGKATKSASGKDSQKKATQKHKRPKVVKPKMTNVVPPRACHSSNDKLPYASSRQVIREEAFANNQDSGGQQ